MTDLDESGQADLKITREMIVAGDAVIRAFAEISDPSELAWRVYTAMQEAQE